MKLQNNYLGGIEQIKAQYLQNERENSKNVNVEGVSFEEILKQKTELDVPIKSSLVFSKHASNRLTERQIELSDIQINRLEEGAQRASEKGIQESLVIVDQLAFIVNIPNSTVITAMEQNESNENIYTNIDGAVII